VKFLGVLFVAVILATPTLAQDRLVPETRGRLEEYDALLRHVLADGFAPDVRLRALLVPSFTTEAVVALKETPAGYRLIAIEPEKQIWNYELIELMRRGNIRVGSGPGRNDKTEAEIDKLQAELPSKITDLPLRRCDVPLDSAFAADLIAIWRKMLGDVRANDRPSIGLDGETDHFALRDGDHELTAKVWSPKESSEAGRFVALTYALRDACRAPTKANLSRAQGLAAALNER
jgi:hypothetical protein